MINELGVTLQQALGLNKATSVCLARIMMAMIMQRTVNLKKLAVGIRGKAKIDSQYRRLQRFFAKISLPQHKLANLLIDLFFPAQARLYLALDRTNWKWGASNLNFLVLSACYQGASIPLYWIALDKKGASCLSERLQVMAKIIVGLGAERIDGLLADREFDGADWFSYLVSKNIAFDIRLKKSCIATNARGAKVQVNTLFRHLKVGEQLVLARPRKIMQGHLALFDQSY